MASTPNQLTDQAVRHAVYLERYKSGAIKEYDIMLRNMEKHILAELSTDITTWTRKRLFKQLTAVKNVIKEYSEGMVGLFSDQIDSLAEYEALFEVKSVGNVAVKYDFDLPSDAQLRAAIYAQPLQVTGPYQGSLLKTFISDWSASSIKKVNNAIQLGFANGVTTQQLVRDLRDVGGAFTQSRKEWSNIVRTGMNHTSTLARERTWQENSDIIKGVKILATLDSRTSTTCRSLDGKTFPINKGPRPPFHINCRSTTVAVIDDRYKIDDAGGVRPAKGVSKTIPANETYYGWLKRQPAKVQDSIVGTTRGQLLRNGGISSERFAELQIGKNFEPLTLDEMRKMEPIAFEKAGV